MDGLVKGNGAHVVIGPVGARGARPGDTLQVDILKTTFAIDWGFVPILPLLGTLPDEFADYEAPILPSIALATCAACPGAPTVDHLPHSKFSMARDMAELMAWLGHDAYGVVAHDRGARVAHQLALDYPDRVSRLVVMDIVPTIEHFERTDMSFALGYYHWFWFAQPHPFPEALISAAPAIWFHAHTARETKEIGFFRAEALAEYLAAAHDPDAICGMCEDYRAAATIDLVHDRLSRGAGILVQCPVLVLWGSQGRIGGWYDPVTLWQKYCAASVSGYAVCAGHYLAEEAPAEVLDQLSQFV